ncbi:MAG: lipoprotein releasing system, transmembrane protein, LolC/E family [Candidatus Accumulibacter appositus]|uniref:Lipoprotein releasing system, transmembrane protein, LolC/E family n=2 Tax=Candidatus Accumulibacter TaxID=327159 RepID=A0A011QTV1_9PROT|nr:MAG: lipoprotein releasing system, transmembrane protein, LolC/E family [Candidatus Accumulibacter appositus]
MISMRGLPATRMRALSTLSWWLIRAQFKTRRAATLLSMLAIALGVALGYAIHLINDAALSDFGRAMKSVQGDPDAVIAARDSAGSVPLATINAIARDPAVLLVAAVIETRVRIDNAPTPVRLIGIDVFSAMAMTPDLLPRQDEQAAAPNILDGGVYASPALLARLAQSAQDSQSSQGKDFGTRAGGTLKLLRGEQQWLATLAGDLPVARPDDLLLVADIAWVQARFGPADGVSEGRVRLAPDTDLASWRQAWAQRLPPGLLIRAGDDDSARVSNLSRAYRVNLNVLALVALLTGAFLVFATQLTAVAQRSTQFALLGVLGLSPRMRLLQVLLEGVAIGVPGSLLGLALGYALAVTFTQVLGGDLGGGYFAGSAPLIVPALAPALLFLALGCLASLAGASYPAYLNRMQPLAQALKTGFAQRPPADARPAARSWRYAHSWVRRLPLLPLLLALAAFALAQLPPLFELPLAGYASIALVLVVGIASAPLLTQLLFGWLSAQPLPAPQRIALQNVAQAPLMAQVAASGLIVSFALTASMVIMVSSFRVAVDQWLDHVLPAPLYLRSKATPLPLDLLGALAAPAAPFAKVERMANAALTIDPQRPQVALLIREIEPRDPAARLPFTGPLLAPPAAMPAVWISEPMAEIYRLAPAQTLRLPLLGREVEVFIGGVWRDYGRQFGAVVISREDYQQLGGNFQPTDLALWPLPGQQAQATAWLAPWAEQYGLEVADSAAIRRLSLSIFDKSFAVTYALEAAAMLIGLFGLAVTLAASVWLRARELATLGALGFDRRMLSHAVMLEGALIASVGLLIGLACGIAIGAILTHVINPQAFHWRMALAIPWTAVFAGAVITLAAAVLASRYAARQATRLPVAQVLANAQ